MKREEKNDGKKVKKKRGEEKIKRNDVISCDWFYFDVFGPNLM